MIKLGSWLSKDSWIKWLSEKSRLKAQHKAAHDLESVSEGRLLLDQAYKLGLNDNDLGIDMGDHDCLTKRYEPSHRLEKELRVKINQVRAERGMKPLPENLRELYGIHAGSKTEPEPAPKPVFQRTTYNAAMDPEWNPTRN